MRKYIFFLILLISTQIKAQPYFDLASLSYGSQFASEIYKGADEGEIKNDFLSFKLNIPVQLNKRFLLLPSAGYEERTFTSAKNNDEFTSQTLFFPLGFQYLLKDSTKSFSGALIYRYNYFKPEKPGIKNDMLGAAFIYGKKMSEGFSLMGGLYYNREFYGNYFMPLLGCKWQASEKFYVWGLLPNNFCMDYAFSKSFHAGVIYKGIEESYNIEPSNGYMHYTEGQLKLFSDIYVGKSGIVLHAEAGQSFERELEFKLDELNGEKRSMKPTETFILQVGVNFRFAINNDFKTPLKPVN